MVSPSYSINNENADANNPTLKMPIRRHANQSITVLISDKEINFFMLRLSGWSEKFDPD